MGGISSCKFSKENENSEVNFKTECDRNIMNKPVQETISNDVTSINKSQNKKFDLSALNITEEELMNIDQKKLIKNFFINNDKNINNCSPVDKFIINNPEEEKATVAFQLVKKPHSDLKKKTPPLEIINEVNTEDNICDHIKVSLNKTTADTKFESINCNTTGDKQLVINNKLESPNKRNHSELTSEKQCLEVYYTLESKQIKDENKNTINDLIIKPNIINNNKLELSQQKSTGKLSSSNKNIQEAWKNTNITSIINDKLYNNLNENDLIYQSEVLKYTLPTNHNSQAYISKFLVITKSELLYFKSKESFLRLQCPLFRLPVLGLIQVNRILVENGNVNKKFKLQNSLHHFYINLANAITDNNLSCNSPNERLNITSNESFSKNKGNTSRLLFGGNNDSAVKKISLIQSSKTNESTIENNNNISKISNSVKKIDFDSQFTLVFAMNNDDLANKWVGVLNYLILKR